MIEQYKYEKLTNMIDRRDISMTLYDSKFNLCHQYLQASSPDLRLLHHLLNDKTCFIYLNFNLDGLRFKLYPYQDMILNDPSRYIIFRAANQIGKSILLDAKAARNLIIDHGKSHNEAIVSKTLNQSGFQMRRVKSLLNSMRNIDWQEIKGKSDSLSVVTVDIKDDKGKIKYTNMLICAPCTEGLLGYDLHELNLDEFEFWTDVDIGYFFTQIAQPRTYTTKGNITIFSNPNGQESYVAGMEQQLLLTGSHKWKTYIFNFLDKPGNTQAEYDQLKHELPRHAFESTVAAIRTFSDRNYFSPDEIERSYDANLKELSMVEQQPYFFLDVGAKHDQSVLVGGYMTLDEGYDENNESKQNYPFMHLHMPIIHVYPVGYPLSRVAGCSTEIQDDDGWHHEKSVREYLEEWSINDVQPMFGFDVTGNLGMKTLFESMNIDADDVAFSGPVKSSMYVRFKYYLEKGLLHRIRHSDWESQASQVIATKSARGYLLINAASHLGKGGKSEDAKLKRIPDDCMDSTAGLIHLCDNPDMITPSLTFF